MMTSPSFNSGQRISLFMSLEYKTPSMLDRVGLSDSTLMLWSFDFKGRVTTPSGQVRKAFSDNVISTSDKISMLTRLEQYLTISDLTTATFSGSTSLSKDVQLLKAFCRISRRLSGKSISFKLKHSSKACDPIYVTELGILTVVIFVHNKNAVVPILVTGYFILSIVTESAIMTSVHSLSSALVSVAPLAYTSYSRLSIVTKSR